MTSKTIFETNVVLRKDDISYLGLACGSLSKNSVEGITTSECENPCPS